MYKRTALRGGVEGIQIQPPAMTKNLFQAFHEPGKTCGEAGEFNKQVMSKLAQPEKMSKFQFYMMRLMAYRFYRDILLKKERGI